MGRFVERILNAATLRRWRHSAGQATTASLSRLRQQRCDARLLRDQLNQLIHTADSRLALPLNGSSFLHLPHGTDWSWRPALWCGSLPEIGIASVPNKTRLGREVQVFHDCAISELTLRQLRNTREEDLAPYGLRMDVFQFDGSFLSLVIELPAEATRGLNRQNLIRMDCIVESEKPIEIFARLNIKHGPNIEQLVRELPAGTTMASVEYDLAYSRLNEKRIESSWIDLIFEAPDLNQVVLRDVTFARYNRANL